MVFLSRYLTTASLSGSGERDMTRLEHSTLAVIAFTTAAGKGARRNSIQALPEEAAAQGWTQSSRRRSSRHGKDTRIATSMNK